MKTHASKNPFSIRPIRKRKLFEKARRYHRVLYAIALLVVGGMLTLGLQDAFAGDVSTTFSDPGAVTARVDTIEYGTPNLPGENPQGTLVKPSFSDTNLRGYLFNQATDGETPETNPLQLYDYTNVWGRMNVINGLWNTGGTVTAPPGGSAALDAGNPTGSVFPGATQQEILRFNVTASNDDITITSINVSNTGTSQPGDFVAHSVIIYRNDVIILDQMTSSPAPPAAISALTSTVMDGTTATFSVKLDIAAEAVAGRTILANATMTARSGSRSVSIPGTNNTSELTIAPVQLTVTAAAGTPASAIFGAGAADNAVAMFRIATDAEATRSVMIDSVTLTKTGTAKNAEIVNLKLYECPTGAVSSCTAQLGQTATALSPATGTGNATAMFNDLDFTVAAGATTYLGVKISTASTTTGGQFAIGVQQASDITTSPSTSTAVGGTALPLFANQFTIGPRLSVSGYTGSAISRATGIKGATIGQFIFNTAGGATTISPSLVLTHRGTAHSALKNIKVFNTNISSVTPIATAATLSSSGGVYFAQFKTFTPSPWNITNTTSATYNILIKADLACNAGVGEYVQFELDPAGIHVSGGKTGLTASGGRYNIIAAACTAESAAAISSSTFDGSTLTPGTPSTLYFGYNSAPPSANIAANIQGSDENLGKLLQANLFTDAFSIQKAEAVTPPPLPPAEVSPVVIYDGLSIQGNTMETGTSGGNLDVRGYIHNYAPDAEGTYSGVTVMDDFRVFGESNFYNTAGFSAGIIADDYIASIAGTLNLEDTVNITGPIVNSPEMAISPPLSIGDDLVINGLTDSPLKVSRTSGETNITFASGANTWQIGNGWTGATGGASSLYFYKTTELMSLDNAGNLTVNGNINTNVTGQIGRFYGATESASTMSTTYTSTSRSEASLSCTTGDYVVGCSGHMFDPENDANAVYAGAWQNASTGCTARALPKTAASGTLGTATNATLYVHTWCFSPNG